MSYVGTARLMDQMRALGGDISVVANDPAVRKSGEIFMDDLVRVIRSGSAFVSECSSAWVEQRSYRRRGLVTG